MNIAIDTGFSIFENILSPQECYTLASTVGGFSSGRAGTRNLMSNQMVSSLAYDSRLRRLAGNVLGSDAVPFRATLFDKSDAANWHVLWHQDRALPLLNEIPGSEWGPWSTKSGVLYALAPRWVLERVVALRVHVDAATEENGPLRVIPGSHKSGVMDASAIFNTVNAASPVPCLVGRGGVLAMRPLLLHSSSKVTDKQRRRVLHLEYADRLDFGGGAYLRVA
jgi:ectoine hydroxylase-related dioxygenase (phytanoyl-CoA dioxygenase family)